jgi:hypothetical protein
MSHPLCSGSQRLLSAPSDPLASDSDTWLLDCGHTRLGNCAVDLSEFRVRLLSCAAPFLAGIRNEIYAFDDPLDAQSLAKARSQGRDLLEILGVASMVQHGVVGQTWRVSDTGHAAFGDALPRDVIDDAESFVARAIVGLALIDEVWVTIQLVQDECVAAWKTKMHTGPGRYPRLMEENLIGKNGVMNLQLACARSNQIDMPNFPHKGKRATLETMVTMSQAGQD